MDKKSGKKVYRRPTAAGGQPSRPSSGKRPVKRRRKRRKKSGRIMRLFCGIALFTGFIIILAGAGRRSPRSGGLFDNLGNLISGGKAGITVTVNDPDSLLSRAREKVIEDYAYRYAETIRTLKSRDVARLYLDRDGEQAMKNEAAFNTLVEIRKMSEIDLKPEYVTMEFNVTGTRQTIGGLRVTVSENNVQKFKHLKDESLSHNSPHEFVIVEKDGRRYIESHLQEEDFYLLAIQAWDKTDGYTPKEKSKNTVKALVDDAKESIEENPSWQNNTSLPAGEYSYNRDRAVEYAKTYWNKHNTRAGYLAFNDLGGNCQNFCSQSIRAGGMAMDFSGPIGAQWKWYGPEVNEEATASGRSHSWTGVDAFYNYAVADFSQGVKCAADVPLSMAQKGDVLQFGAYGEWRHSVLVTDVLYNNDGSVKDIIIASNTADRWNYPASAYVYRGVRLIHILGQ